MLRSVLRVTGAGLVLTLVMIVVPAASATPVTIDFESGATVNQKVTNEYGIPGTPAGPTFKQGSQLNQNLPQCTEPTLVSNQPAYSGSRTLAAGCPGGDIGFTSAAYFSMGYFTDHIEYEVAIDGSTAGISEIWTTGFDVNGTVVAQEQTLLPAQGSPTYKAVPLISGSVNIAYVAIELGTKGTPTNSPSGVTLQQLSKDLFIDDLTYYPPSSPPASSFLLGVDHPTERISAGQHVDVHVSVTWFNNPNPTSTPVALEASEPSGVHATFSPQTTTSLTSTMTISVDKTADPTEFQKPVTLGIDGYVDKGTGSEKHASTSVAVEIVQPFIVSPIGSYLVEPCTNATLHVSIPKDPQLNDPIQVDVYMNGSDAAFIATSKGQVVSPKHVSASFAQQGNEATMDVTIGVAPGTAGSSGNVTVVVQPSGYGVQSANGSVGTYPGYVDSMSPASPIAPQFGKPGDLVTVIGKGFCPGVKVALGLPAFAVDAESVAGDGQSLTFRVPRGATSGPLHILPAAPGVPFDGPNFFVRTFRDMWGFSWGNTDYGMRMTGDMIDELFGKDETNINVFGWLIRKPEAGMFGDMTNKHIPGGICFGMAFSALQIFMSPNWTTVFPHRGDGGTAWNLMDEKKPSDPLLRWVIERFSLQFTDELIPVELGQLTGQAINAHDPTQDAQDIQKELASGFPLVIGLVHWNGISLEGHTVLAYDSIPTGNGGLNVMVYNPNSPYSRTEESDFSRHISQEFTESTINIDANGHWYFLGLPGWDGPDSNLILYPRSVLPIINGKSPHLPNVLVAAIMVVFGSGGDAVTQVTDDHGGKLIDGKGPADPKQWPRGVAPIPVETGQNTPLQLIGADPKLAGTLTATVERGKGGGAMNLNLPGLQAALETGAKDGQTDHVIVDDHAHSIGYQTDAASSAFGGTLISAGGAGGARAAASKGELAQHVVEFKTTSASGGGEQVTFAAGRAFEIKHDGAPANLSVTLSAFGADGAPVAVELPPMRLARGATLTVAPLDWRRLGSSKVRLTTTVRGHRTTRLVKGRSLARRFATLRGATLRGSAATLSLALRVRRAPKGSWLSPAVTVMRGAKVVARTKPAQVSAVAAARKVQLTLTKRLPKGRYSVRVRLLETVVRGSAQASIVVTRTLALTSR